MSFSMETECKLKIESKEKADLILSDNFWGTKPWKRFDMKADYYDYPSLDLSEKKYTLRFRTENGNGKINLKMSLDNQNGVATRKEYEQEAGSFEQGTGMLMRIPELYPILSKGRFISRVSMAFSRYEKKVEFKDSIFSVSVDIGWLGREDYPFCELEAEFKEGNRSDTDEFCQVLSQQFGLEPEPQGKYSRALKVCSR